MFHVTIRLRLGCFFGIGRVESFAKYFRSASISAVGFYVKSNRGLEYGGT